MKAYTDLEQSKKLAEILPPENADMHYNNASYKGVDYVEPFSIEPLPYEEALGLMKVHKTNLLFEVIPAWSLAALLDILPEPYQLTSNKEGKVQLTIIHHLEKEYYDNPVDACVEMIIKLKEMNLI